ncbi:hypothetical protein T310_7648 [Rasamsonia emersonii CBS 393.64]|uniref:Extradiol ring-cleavage dioxygenase class III enzyme subunit B domain-containing protein n=1 Tax=Rasamsonia emersonii (strain ATCC 16479 / CBS 393.64 / IMI 116815) TaxID=1408163 RepID=A0A0F4YKK3_RASE3|nr:hypothetical protein T310_7648 [Rasamsonia emersonii CBS 393.64]KKA18406.1 hypothetical protein T310_7648 [Rasamsonia emersonii CBS 393.64]
MRIVHVDFDKSQCKGKKVEWKLKESRDMLPLPRESRQEYYVLDAEVVVFAVISPLDPSSSITFATSPFPTYHHPSIHDSMRRIVIFRAKDTGVENETGLLVIIALVAQPFRGTPLTCSVLDLSEEDNRTERVSVIYLVERIKGYHEKGSRQQQYQTLLFRQDCSSVDFRSRFGGPSRLLSAQQRGGHSGSIGQTLLFCITPFCDEIGRLFFPVPGEDSNSGFVREPVASSSSSFQVEYHRHETPCVFSEPWRERISLTNLPFDPLSQPNIMYQHDHPAHRKLQEIGREITTKVKPKAVVVFSGHWQAGRDTIQVNTAEVTDLIYDFYGFPKHYYEEKYPNVGSREVAEKVLAALKEAGIKAEGVKRGLDHGVWVSLFDSEDPIQHYRLGQALSKLRDENIQIITSGMAVHNLRDMRFTWGDPRPLPYAVSFDDALKEAVTTAPEKREKAMADLLKRPDARQAHPTFDHILPIHVGAGAAGEDVGKRLFTLNEGSLGWAQFRFGEVPTTNGSL